MTENTKELGNSAINLPRNKILVVQRASEISIRKVTTPNFFRITCIVKKKKVE